MTNPEHEPHQCRSHECKRVRAEMQAEIDRLRNALSELRPYATHSDDCGDMSAYNNDPVPRCDCGLDSTLDAIDELFGQAYHAGIQDGAKWGPFAATKAPT